MSIFKQTETALESTEPARTDTKSNSRFLIAVKAYRQPKQTGVKQNQKLEISIIKERSE